MSTDTKIRVLVIDDSAVARKAVSDGLNRDPQITVVSTAINPVTAEHKIQRDKPDAIVLDLEMPRIHGLSFLKTLKKKSSIPVVVFSALSKNRDETTTKALGLGAAAVLSKPNGQNAAERIGELARILKRAVKSKRKNPQISNERPSGKFVPHKPAKITPPNPAPKRSKQESAVDLKVIAIGASTGGTDALRSIFKSLPKNCPPIVSVIHMPKDFTNRFAQRLNGICSIEVREAGNGDRLVPGLALIAPGDQHLELRKDQHGYFSLLQNSPPVMRHRPSVEVLFQSVAKIAHFNALGILLTGMGADGAEGLNQIHRNGGYTIAQNEETCVVFGMPNEAIKRGGVDEVLPIESISESCIAWMEGSLSSMKCSVS